MTPAVLVAYEASGTGWVGWVVLAAILSFLAVGFLSPIRGRLRYQECLSVQSRHLARKWNLF